MRHQQKGWSIASVSRQLKLAILATLLVVFQLAVPCVFAQEIGAPVFYSENEALGQRLQLPVYHWWQSATNPRGVVVAVHGLVMHGRSFDGMGRALAEQGYSVYALDLRGYGRYLTEGHRFCTSKEDCKRHIDYDKSYDDMVRLGHALRETYPNLPMFVVGESLGGSMIIKLAACNPELVDGLILSAPAVKRHSFIDPYLIANAGMVVANPRAQLDVMPFVRHFSSDDPRVIQEKEDDPLLRRRMSAYEIMQSGLAVHKTESYISNIPSDVPVLVIQGSADRCIKAQSIMVLLSKLRSSDQTVKWFHERGHILLETEYVKPDTMNAVVSWLNSHVESPMIQAKQHQDSAVIAVDLDQKASQVSAR